jgi:hypothetical protein
MEHDEAIDSLTAEKYILAELTMEEREAFEEHFFDCTECSTSVRDAATVAAAVRLGKAHASALRPGRMKWWAAAVAAAAGLAFVYLPQLARRNEVLPVSQFARVAAAEQNIELESTRAASEPVAIHAGQPVALYFIVPPPEHPAPSYTSELLDSTARTIATQSISNAQAQNAVAMHLKAQTLQNGDYKVVIRDGEREIAAYPFTVLVR